LLQFGDVMTTLKIAAVLAAVLLSTSINMPAKPKTQIVKAKPQDVECLAKNIYHEARGEPFQGQVAVALVTVNRVASGLFQKTVCSVVYADKQFSWTSDKHKKVKDQKAWASAVEVATAVLSRRVYEPDFTAIYFHASHVAPIWAKTKTVITKIGNHIFYA
jgi:spore germination cell wall hydrolase CwlJ-like protein